MGKTLPVVQGSDPSANLYANFPSGWYVLTVSRELGRGQVLTKRLAGRDVVLFRTERGEVSAVDAYCPHMGAHFGHGGCVKGETIHCPFHAFRFGTDGKCVATGYGTPAPPKLRVKTYPVRERHGLVLVWLGTAGEAPTFEVPDIDTTNWMDAAWRVFAMRGHPQETSENSVDMGHLNVVHGYKDVKVLRELRCEPGLLSVRYAMKRPYVQEVPFLGDIYTEFDISVWGLGYSRVEVEAPALGLRSRHFVFATPVDTEKLELRIGFAHRRFAASSPLAKLPGDLVDRIVRRIGIAVYAHDVAQDFDIWNFKKYVHPPQLAVGDGPVGAYRRWAKQFYPLLTPPSAADASTEGRDAAE